MERIEVIEKQYFESNASLEGFNNGKSRYAIYVKPAIDIALSLVLLILLLPLFIVISLMIRLDSEGPSIFKQHRVGKDEKVFIIYKFRTMYTDAPNEGRSPINHSDNRITRVGRLLRTTSLDELPQLINILKGEMSFIGPRPEQRLIVERCYSSCEKGRFLVKPGITGLWQVSQDRMHPIHENLHHDFEYINKVSFLLDAKIVIKTIQVVIKSNTA